MRKIKLLQVLFFITFTFLASCGNSSDEIRIGNQIWMTENLNVDKFRNGDPIPEARTKEEWNEAARSEQPVWCWSSLDLKEQKRFGKLYNLYAVTDPRGLAPKGWKIPATEDITKLILTGEKFKNILDSEIDLPMAGYRNGSNGSLLNVGILGYYWSSIVSGAHSRHLFFNSSYTHMFIDVRADGKSVRCIKD